MDNIFSGNWESQLETQLLSFEPYRKTAYICSPLEGKSEEEMLQNIKNARAYMYYAITEIGCYARAPHAYLPMLLNNAQPSERRLAILFGDSLLQESDMMLVCGNWISEGMRNEIIRASFSCIPIYTFEESVYRETANIVAQQAGNSKPLVHFDLSHAVLGNEYPVIHAQNAGCFM